MFFSYPEENRHHSSSVEMPTNKFDVTIILSVYLLIFSPTSYSKVRKGAISAWTIAHGIRKVKSKDIRKQHKTHGDRKCDKYKNSENKTRTSQRNVFLG